MTPRRPESPRTVVRDREGEVVHYRDVELPPDDRCIGDEASPALQAWFDEWGVCPGCSRRTLASDLCAHDDPDTGPLCDYCCRRDHQDNRDPLGDAA